VLQRLIAAGVLLDSLMRSTLARGLLVRSAVEHDLSAGLLRALRRDLQGHEHVRDRPAAAAIVGIGLVQKLCTAVRARAEGAHASDPVAADGPQLIRQREADSRQLATG